MLTMLSIQDWLGLALAMLLALGPGVALWAVFPGRHQFDRTLAYAILLGLALAFWPIALVWLQALHLTLNASGVLGISVAGWLIGLVIIRPGLHALPDRMRWIVDADRVVLWVIIVLTLILNLLALQQLQAGPGADSYHHTVIPRLIMEQGGIPDHFQPYAPLVSFTYHFGFHSWAAVIAWLTGLDPLIVVPLLAQCLPTAAALTTAFLAEAMTGRRRVATITAALVGLISVFPAYMLNWGRDPQLAGEVLLPIFLGGVWYWFNQSRDRYWLLAIGWLAAGLALTHYRVTLMAASGVVVLIGVVGLMRHLSLRTWLRVIGGLSMAALFALILVTPWIGHVLLSLRRGYPIEIGLGTLNFFSLNRLGNAVAYPTNSIVIGLTIVALVIGWLRREKVVIALSLWAAVMLALSAPRFAGWFVDTVSVSMVLYVPLVICIAWLVDELASWLSGMKARAAWALWLGLLVLALWGGAYHINISGMEDNKYVWPADVQAMAWIRANIPPSARFMVNLFHLNFAERHVVGSDAGYWLPYLTGRAAVTMPIMFDNERASTPDLVDRLVALDQLKGHLTSPEAIAELQRQGITHVYVGMNGGPISAVELIKSPNFKLVYQNQAAYVFELVSAAVPR
jgi:hypothetical protein